MLNEAKDDRNVLEILKAELNFLEKGGYGRSVRTPWLPTSVFQDSPSCFCFPYHDHDKGCSLMQFVPVEYRSEGVPCHYIPLNEDGDTVELLERSGDRDLIEGAMKNWLQVKIAEVEQELAAAESHVESPQKSDDPGSRTRFTV
jgi:hypothetical protein